MIETKKYKWIRLPSRGLCYKSDSALRRGRIAVRNLTAKDENIIFSKELFRNKNICLTLLKEKIIGDINVYDICSGDKEAIILFFIKENYGNIVDIDDMKFDLRKIKYKNIDIETDDNGFLNYVLKNGDIIKYKFLPFKEEEKTMEDALNFLYSIKNHNISIKDVYMLFTKYILTRVIVSINGVTDTVFIKNYIDGLVYEEVYPFQHFITDNAPGLDIKTTNGIIFDDTIFKKIKYKF